jgi:hypothetical protein
MKIMMVFIMNYLKKYKFLLKLLLFFNIVISLNINASEINLSNFKIENNADGQELFFEQDISINNNLFQAIQKGIPLKFDINIKVTNFKKFWFNEIIFDDKFSFEIKYRNLLKKYQLRNMDGNYKYFSDIEMLKETINLININLGYLVFSEDTLIEVGVKLDSNQLPKPLQINRRNTTWNVSSETYAMKVKEIN